MRIETFIIHLDRAKKRAPQVQALKARLPRPVTVIDAIDGLLLQPGEIDAVYRRALHRPRYPFTLRNTEIGCFLSHRKAWQAIVDGGLDAGLIVEDDVEPDDAALAKILAFACAEIRQGDYIRFPYRAYTDKGKVAAHRDGVTLVEPAFVGLGMQMQLVSREAAVQLLWVTQQFDRPVDTTIQMPWLTEMRMLAARPTSIDDLLLQNASFNRAQIERDLAALYFDGAIASAHVDLAWLPASGAPSRSALLG